MAAEDSTIIAVIGVVGIVAVCFFGYLAFLYYAHNSRQYYSQQQGQSTKITTFKRDREGNIVEMIEAWR